MGKGFLDVDIVGFWRVWFRPIFLAHFEELQMGNLLRPKVKKYFDEFWYVQCFAHTYCSLNRAYSVSICTKVRTILVQLHPLVPHGYRHPLPVFVNVCSTRSRYRKKINVINNSYECEYGLVIWFSYSTCPMPRACQFCDQ